MARFGHAPLHSAQRIKSSAVDQTDNKPLPLEQSPPLILESSTLSSCPTTPIAQAVATLTLVAGLTARETTTALATMAMAPTRTTTLTLTAATITRTRTDRRTITMDRALRPTRPPPTASRPPSDGEVVSSHGWVV